MVKNKEACNQFIDYSGLAYSRDFRHDGGGTYHPMDIDAYYQFSRSMHKEMKVDEAFLYYEFKKGDAQMSIGEEIGYTRNVDYLTRGGGFAIAAVISHNDNAKDGDIDGANGIVAKYYRGDTGKWYKPNKPVTAREFTDIFMRFIGFDVKEEN